MSFLAEDLIGASTDALIDDFGMTAETLEDRTSFRFQGREVTATYHDDDALNEMEAPYGH